MRDSVTCPHEDPTCVIVTRGFVENRIRDLAEIARLKEELAVCEARHHGD